MPNPTPLVKQKKNALIEKISKDIERFSPEKMAGVPNEYRLGIIRGLERALDIVKHGRAKNKEGSYA